MRLMDIMLAMPSLLLSIVIVAILGPGLINAMIAVAITYVPHYARLTRAVGPDRTVEGLRRRRRASPAPARCG